MSLRIFVWFFLSAGAVFTSGVSGAQAQPPSPAPRAVLGAMLRELSAQDAQTLGTKGVQGAFVQSIVPNGPAERAGLRAGDIIVSVNRQAVASGAHLVQVIGNRSPGDLVELVVLRSGRRQTISVTLAAPSGAPTRGTSPPAQTEPPAKAAGGGVRTGGPASGEMIRLRPFSVRDPQLNNMEALRLLVPADWRVQARPCNPCHRRAAHH
jgi:predicted metalloprotease with PDZ domain